MLKNHEGFFIQWNAKIIYSSTLTKEAPQQHQQVCTL